MSAPHTALGTAIAELAEHALADCAELRTAILDFADQLATTNDGALTNAKIADRLRNLVGRQS
ncbi:hypothetical protein [Nocardia tengchongensis]|uniref:hypothetical protein n=1 Tax=Nocardia tengchongensis TaxID=2055889 RepID=UPI0036B62A8C